MADNTSTTLATTSTPVPTSTASSRFLSDAWWKAFATGVAATAAKLAPIVVLLFGLKPEQSQVFTEAAGWISQIVLALGALVIACAGLIETAHHFTLPPPSPNAPKKVD